MAVNSKLNFDIFARDNASPVFNKFGKEVKGADGASKGMAGSLRTLAKGFIGLAVVGKATQFIKESVAEARESQKVNAQTAAVIKSTGGAANVTAKEFGNLATAISNKTAIDDEAIQSGQNMLATFTNVRNEVGKGNDIFNQATRAAVDMGVAMGTSPTQAALMLGKALNDPAKGLTRLTKVGVTFTDAQKAQVKAMVAAGDTAGAQKVILAELTKEYGGSAAAQATAGEKFTTSFNNLKESIGTKLLPVLDKMATAGTKAIAWLDKNPEAVYAFAAAVGVLGVALIAVAAPVVAAFVAANAFTIAIGAIVAALVYAYTRFETFRKVVNTVFNAVMSIVRFAWNSVLRPIFIGIGKAIGLLMIGWGKMLQALGKVPGFGWAKKAGDAMVGAGEKAINLGKHIKEIPDISIGAKTNFAAAYKAINALNKKAQAAGGRGARVRYTSGYGGGQTMAMGTSNFSGGRTWVGERGPELLELPRGSRITPNAKSMAMAGNGSGNRAAFNIENFNAGGLSARQVADEILWMSKR